MVQRLEGAAIEQAGFDVEKPAFHFALGLRPADAARLGFEAVVGGEGKEFRVVQGAIGVAAQDDRLEVVVQADARGTAEVMERMDVLAQRRNQVHRLDPAQVLPPRVGEQVAEQVDAAATFTHKVDVINAKIHLCLRLARSRSAPPRRPARGRNSRRRCRTIVYRPAKPRTAAPARRLDGQVRILGEQFLQQRLVGVEDAAARRGLGKGALGASARGTAPAPAHRPTAPREMPNALAIARIEARADAAAQSRDAAFRS